MVSSFGGIALRNLAVRILSYLFLNQVLANILKAARLATSLKEEVLAQARERVHTECAVTHRVRGHAAAPDGAAPWATEEIGRFT